MSSTCGPPFENASDHTLWSLWLTDWIITILFAASLLFLALCPNLIGALSGQSASGLEHQSGTLLALTQRFRKEDGDWRVGVQ